MRPKTEKALKEASFIAILVTSLLCIADKTDFDKWRTYRFPLSWKEFFSRLPFYFGLGLLAFIISFLYLSFYLSDDKIKATGKRYCLHCKLVVSNYAICPTCNKETEPLQGVFERHPELRD